MFPDICKRCQDFKYCDKTVCTHHGIWHRATALTEALDLLKEVSTMKQLKGTVDIIKCLNDEPIKEKEDNV